MATHVLSAQRSDIFPDTTSVSVYPQDSFVMGQGNAPAPGGIAAIFTGAFSGTAGLSVTGVTADQRYVAYGANGGVLRFTAIPSAFVTLTKMSPWKTVVANRRTALGFT